MAAERAHSVGSGESGSRGELGSGRQRPRRATLGARACVLDRVARGRL